MRIEAKKTLPGLIVLALILGTGFYLGRPRVIYGNPTGEIPLVMPEEIGGYRAERMFFCTNTQCARAFRESELTGEGEAHDLADAKCPICGSGLSSISIGEEKLLPDNTPIFRREYVKDGVPPIHVTIVFSGIERRSIHRPQVCLVSQGNRITNEYPYDIDTGDGTMLTMRVLDIQHVYGNAQGEKPTVAPAVYAYWLFNPERETDSHLSRFLRMAIDNSFRDYRPRWGYVSISIMRNPSRPDAWKEQLAEFIPLFYPIMKQVREDLDAQRNITTVIARKSADINVNSAETEAATKNPRLRNNDKTESK